MEGQRTIKRAIDCTGVGLHSGAEVRLRLLPAPADHGLRFRRVDLPGTPEIPATWAFGVESPLCTMLQREDGVSVQTCEHLLSALAGEAIDNLLIELNGQEVPIMDGSAEPFTFLLRCAGARTLAEPRRRLHVLKTVSVQDGDRRASLGPGWGLSLDFELDLRERDAGRHRWAFRLSPEGYRREVARARTFGFLEEVEQLRNAGLARGGSLENAIVLDRGRVVNPEGLRFGNELVRHKVLDAIGDLSLAGGPIVGHYSGVKAGHALTLRLLRTLFATEGAWRWVEDLPFDAEMPALAHTGLRANISAAAGA